MSQQNRSEHFIPKSFNTCWGPPNSDARHVSSRFAVLLKGVRPWPPPTPNDHPETVSVLLGRSAEERPEPVSVEKTGGGEGGPGVFARTVAAARKES